MAQSRCALAHALLRLGQTADCLDQLEIAETILRPAPRIETDRLTAVLMRVRGEALLSIGENRQALYALEQAEGWFGGREPWAHAELLILLGDAHRALRDHVRALAAHTRAVDLFHRQADTVMEARARTALHATVRAAAGRYAAWRVHRGTRRFPSERG
jgi:tetratricopeptide (TPR) repeat protein